MRPHNNDLRDLAIAVPLAFDWKKCGLAAAGLASLGLGVELVAASVSLGGAHVWHVLAALAGATPDDPATRRGALAGLIAAPLWGIYVWSRFGGTIARLSAVEIATGRRESLRSGWRFSRRKFRAFFWSPTGALLLAALLLLFPFVGSQVGRIGFLGLGPAVVALFHGLTLVFSFVAVVLVIGATFGSGLMFGAVAVEGTDNFDAVSRSLNYLYGKPWHAIGYRLAGLAIGAFVLPLTLAIVWAVWATGDQVLRLGMGAAAHADLTGLWSQLIGQGRAGGASIGLASIVYAGVGLGYGCLAAGLVCSYAISSAVIQYLLLRYRNDATALSEVMLVERQRVTEEEIAVGRFLLEIDETEDADGLEDPPTADEATSAAGEAAAAEAEPTPGVEGSEADSGPDEPPASEAPESEDGPTPSPESEDEPSPSPEAEATDEAAPSPAAEAAGEPAPTPAASPETEAAEQPEPTPAGSPETEAAEEPAASPAGSPETEATEAPSPAGSPETEAAEEPAASPAASPETEATEAPAPSPETEAPEASPAASPETEAAEAPAALPAESSETEAAEAPAPSPAASPESDAADEPAPSPVEPDVAPQAPLPDVAPVSEDATEAEAAPAWSEDRPAPGGLLELPVLPVMSRGGTFSLSPPPSPPDEPVSIAPEDDDHAFDTVVIEPDDLQELDGERP